jgi:HAD superfamily phosphatase (TIGR01668 family)
MLEKFFPDKIFESFKEISYEFLKKNKLEAVILDIDNTLVTYEQAEPTDEVIEWIRGLQQKNIKVSIVSNAKRTRVEKFNEKLGLFFVPKASKPSTYGFLKAAKQMQVQPYQTAVVGDQIFTDIHGGKRANMFAIFIKPISKEEMSLIRIKRFVEKFVFYIYKKRRKNHEN